MLERWEDPITGTRILRLALTASEMRRLRPEQLDMLADAEFLIEAALRGDVEGPLTLPRTRVPVRN